MTAVEVAEETTCFVVQMFVCAAASQRSALAAAGDVPTMREGGPELLVQFAEDYGGRTVESNMTLEAVTADTWEAGLLEIASNTPILALSGVDRSPVGFSRTLCRSDTFRFSFRLVRDGD